MEPQDSVHEPPLGGRWVAVRPSRDLSPIWSTLPKRSGCRCCPDQLRIVRVHKREQLAGEIVVADLPSRCRAWAIVDFVVPVGHPIRRDLGPAPSVTQCSQRARQAPVGLGSGEEQRSEVIDRPTAFSRLLDQNGMS